MASTGVRRILPPGGPFARPRGGRHLRFSLGWLWYHCVPSGMGGSVRSHWPIARSPGGYGARARTILLVWFIDRDFVEQGLRSLPNGQWPSRRLSLPARDRGTVSHKPALTPDPDKRSALRAPAAFAKRLNGWRGSAAFSPSVVKIRVRQRPGPLKKG